MIYSRYLSNSVKPSAPRPLYSRLHVFFTSLYPNRKVNDFKIDLYSHSTFKENVLECSRRMHPDVSSCKFYFLIHEKTYFCLTGSRISRSNITATQNYRSKQVRNGPSVNPYRQTFGEWLRGFSGNFFQILEKVSGKASESRPKIAKPGKVWKKFPGYPLSHLPFFGNSFRDLPIWVNGSVLGPKMWSVFCFTKNRRQKCTFDCHQNLSPILVNWVSCIKMVNWLNLTLI